MQEWTTHLLEDLGYADIALLMALENVIPPIPSEAIMPAAGLAAAHGELSLVGVIAAGSLGAVAGTLPWYFVGRFLGTEKVLKWIARHGGKIGLSEANLTKARNKFSRYGAWFVFAGRLVPGIRSIISIPAGGASMPLTPFVTLTAAGTTLWTSFLALVGYQGGALMGWGTTI